jgi:predicted aminopeptidase
LAWLCAIATLCGCRTAGFYTQAIHGQYQIVAQRESIVKLLADTNTPALLRHDLQLVQNLRAFAATNLDLPVDGHYLTYADVHRPYVVWNVQAARSDSLEPKTWWFPFLGGLEYRGYFSETAATNYAAFLRAKGYDVSVGGVEAYSTLGWFHDPVLNTFIHSGEPELAEVLFHELGHQRVFAGGDTDFNEAFATAVGQEGARRWLITTGKTNLLQQYAVALNQNDQFVHLVMTARARLETVYGDTRDRDGKVRAASHPPASAAVIHTQKQRVLDQLRLDCQKLRSSQHRRTDYDEWFGDDLNNAKLNSVANYYDFLPGFRHLLELNAGDLNAFYDAVQLLADLPKEERHRRLRMLAAQDGSSTVRHR